MFTLSLARVQVWRNERAATVAASLEQLFGEPALLPTLAACLAAREPEEAGLLLGGRPGHVRVMYRV